MKKQNSLTPTDWIMAGFRTLASGGVQAIKIEGIAKNLKVSKGSFYWHFKDVSSLKREMLEHWENIATHDIISDLSSNASTKHNINKLTPKEQLRLLVQIATSDVSEPYGGVSVEPAIRSWARYDENVAMTLNAVDTARLEFVRGLFEKVGIHSAQCHTFSHILYASLIGLEQLSCLDDTNSCKELNKLLDLMFQQNNA